MFRSFAQPGSEVPFPVKKRDAFVQPVSVPFRQLLWYSTAVEMQVSRIPKEVSRKKAELVVSRFRAFEDGKLCTFDDCHKVDFTVSEVTDYLRNGRSIKLCNPQRIIVTGIAVYATRCPNGERNIYVELLDGVTGDILAEGHLRVACNGVCKVYQIR